MYYFKSFYLSLFLLLPFLESNAKNMGGACDASFTVNVNLLTADFNVINQDPNATYFWSFGDGFYSSAPLSTTHTYLAAGTYNAYLIVSLPGICDDTVYQNVNVYSASPCDSVFQVSVTNNFAEFEVQNISPTATYYWLFDDGYDGFGPAVNHVYTAEGIYSVCLEVNDASQGCQSLLCQNVIIDSIPVNACDPTFAFTVVGSTVYFSNTVFSGTYYDWDFGDFYTGSGANPVHSYDFPGGYQVCLTAYNINTQCQETVCDSVFIIPNNPNCNADFVYSGNNNIVNFQSNLPSPTANYYWYFGDGSFSSGVAVSHVFANQGWYEVCLTVLDTATNCQNVVCDSVFVNLSTFCDASFSSQVVGDTDGYFDMQNYNPAAIYYWSYGDGDIGFGYSASSSHVYVNPGWYEVCLNMSLTDSIGSCQAFFCDSVYIPLGTINSSCEPIVYESDSALNHSYWVANPIGNASYTWTLNGNFLAYGTGIVTVKQDTTDQEICVIVNHGACSDTTCTILYGLPTSCGADFNLLYITPVQVQASALDTLPLSSYDWYLDGVFLQSGGSPIITDPTSGLLCLVVSNSFCTDTTCQDISWLSIDKQNELLAHLYPNPISGDELFVEFPDAGADQANLSLRDVRGVEILSFNTRENNFSLPVSNLSSGVYFLQIEKGDKRIVKKLVK